MFTVLFEDSAALIGVNRHAIGTPDRHGKGTPHRRWGRLVPVANRRVRRAGSGFARDALMTWCEANGVDFLFGLARNERLVAEIAAELAAAEEESKTTGQPARRFNEFCWSTRDSWSRQRRVVCEGRMDWGEANPRFVVTSLNREDAEPQRLYEEIYCARGDMENRIKSNAHLGPAGADLADKARGFLVRPYFSYLIER